MRGCVICDSGMDSYGRLINKSKYTEHCLVLWHDYQLKYNQSCALVPQGMPGLPGIAGPTGQKVRLELDLSF